MGRVTRKYEIARRQRRRNKIRDLREKLAKTTDISKMKKITDKIIRIHPFYPLKD